MLKTGPKVQVSSKTSSALVALLEFSLYIKSRRQFLIPYLTRNMQSKCNKNLSILVFYLWTHYLFKFLEPILCIFLVNQRLQPLQVLQMIFSLLQSSYPSKYFQLFTQKENHFQRYILYASPLLQSAYPFSSKLPFKVFDSIKLSSVDQFQSMEDWQQNIMQ